MEKVGHSRINQVYLSAAKNVPAFKGEKAPADLENDMIEISAKGISSKESEQIKHDAKVTASGWSIFGGVFSTLYFGMRADKTVANKYGLDVEKDNDLIKDIKRKQVAATLPGLVQLGFLSWIYFKFCEDPKKQAI